MPLPLNPPAISVIIPVYNGGENFRRCLASLVRSLPAPDEIIVVADGEGDGSWRIAEEFKVPVLRLNGPNGPAHARNRGACIARGNLLFFLDADVALPPDTIGKLADIFYDQPHLAAVMGSYDDSPLARDFISQFKNLFHHYIHQTSSEEASTFWGGCGAIRREVFFAIGGFDEGYRHPSIEDIELGYRLRKANYPIRLNKTLQVKHLKRWDMISLLESDIFRRALPWMDLILRRRWLVNDLNLRVPWRISLLLIYGLLGALIGIGGWSGSILLAGILALSLLMLNLPLYRFFNKKRGLIFLLKAVPLHWLYYFYCGLALMISLIRHSFQRDNPAEKNLSGPDGKAER